MIAVYRKGRAFATVALVICFGTCLISGLTVQTASAQTQLPTAGPFHNRVGSLWNPRRQLFVAKSGLVQTRTQALVLRLMVAAISKNEQSFFNDPVKARRLVDVLTHAPAFRDGKRTRWQPGASHAHIPGFFGTVNKYSREQHVSIDAAASVALAEAYQARTQLSLSATQIKNIRRAVIKTSSHGLFSPTRIRAGQLMWTADVLWAKYLVGGSTAKVFVKNYRRALDSMKPIVKRMLTADGGFRYNWKYPDIDVNRLNSPEYSAISLSGLQYLSWARQRGLTISSAERTVYRRWIKRVVWGAFANSGMLNWDTGLGAHRRYISQYWGWTILATQSLTGTGLLSRGESQHLAAICRAGQLRFNELTSINNGYLPRTLYGVANTFIDPAADRSMGTIRTFFALNVCPDATSPAVAARSFDREQKQFSVTSNRYATSIVGWNNNAAYGALPTKLLDGRGNAIGGLGSWTTNFDLQAGGIRFGDGRASGQTFTYSSIPGSSPLQGRNAVFKVGVTKGAARGSLTYRFVEDGFSINGATSVATERTWRIPIASGSVVTVDRSKGKTVASITPSGGAKWQVTIPEIAKAASTVSVSRNRFDPTVNKMLVIRLPKGTALKMWINISALATP